VEKLFRCRREDFGGDQRQKQRDRLHLLGKLNSTFGGFSAPAVAVKYGRSLNPSAPANSRAGKRLIAVLYACAASLKRPRSTAMRFSVPSSCACKSRKLALAFKSG